MLRQFCSPDLSSVLSKDGEVRNEVDLMLSSIESYGPNYTQTTIDFFSSRRLQLQSVSSDLQPTLVNSDAVSNAAHGGNFSGSDAQITGLRLTLFHVNTNIDKRA